MLFLAEGVQAQASAESGPVQPGDRFVVQIHGDSSSLQVVTIDDRMVVDLPLAGPLVIRGLSAHAATDSVRARLLAFRRPGTVTVTFERRISVLGDVRRPDLYYIDRTVRLRAALAMAGGVAETGRTREVLLLRDGVQTKISDWRNTPAGDIELRSGDELVVPRERWIKRNSLTLVSGAGVVASLIVAFVLR
ncbi:MAG: polysaccharide biosynthesis/export family protein [Gemmatimonadaceae bacterium]